VVGQAEQLRVFFSLLEHVPDVARADAQRFRRDDRVLRGDEGVRARQQQVAGAGRAAVPHARQPIDARDGEQVDPLLVVGDEDKHPGRPGDERLVVAGHSQPVLKRLVLDLDDRVQHQVAGRRRPHRRA
jgi:hypothetical protein